MEKSHKSFFKNKEELVSLPHFLHDFWRKMFFTLYSVNWPNFIEWFSILFDFLYSFTFWIMCIIIFCFPIYDVKNFEISISFWSSRFFIWQKSFSKGGNLILAISLKHVKSTIITQYHLTLKRLIYPGHIYPRNFKI